MKTAAGKEITITAAFRMPVEDYARVQELAQRRSVKMSHVLRGLVRDGLNVVDERERRNERRGAR